MEGRSARASFGPVLQIRGATKRTCAVVFVAALSLTPVGCATPEPTHVVVDFPSEAAFASGVVIEVLVFRHADGCIGALDAAITAAEEPDFTTGELSVCDFSEDGSSVSLKEVGDEDAQVVALTKDEGGTVLFRGCVVYQGEAELVVTVAPTIDGLRVVEQGVCATVDARCGGEC